MFPVHLFCSINFNLSKNQLVMDDKKLGFDSERDPAMMAGGLSNLRRNLSRVISLLEAFSSKHIFLQSQTLVFYPII